MMQLLAPAPNVCPICATRHADTDPHNAQSLYYQYRFYSVRGRWPTWADAIAHCSLPMRRQWEVALQQGGHWTEPTPGIEPIADPPAESIRQAVGDANSRGFGPEKGGE